MRLRRSSRKGTAQRDGGRTKALGSESHAPLLRTVPFPSSSIRALIRGRAPSVTSSTWLVVPRRGSLPEVSVQGTS